MAPLQLKWRLFAQTACPYRATGSKAHRVFVSGGYVPFIDDEEYKNIKYRLKRAKVLAILVIIGSLVSIFNFIERLMM